jgi:mRNA-degrading endonuclease YafQ of YafQ-DinJ toxin-antitoxin module
MRYEYKSSFDKVFKKLGLNRQEKVIDAINILIDFFENRKKVKGLGLKNLRENYWEIRVNVKDRIIFTLEKDKVAFIIVGNHDEIKKFLRNI